jgi:putative RNA 2'-phosphotransferase
MQGRQISKFLSLVLRHEPEKIGLGLDAGGWVGVTELLDACRAHGFSLTLEELHNVVDTDSKKRFAFSEDGLKIRASQGHSIAIDLGYEPVDPPHVLYHGTAERFLSSIMERGLLRGERHHVHLSSDVFTATTVGRRHGRPVVLEVDSNLMSRDGHLFYRSQNGVWLTEHVPPKYLSVLRD